MEGKRFNFLIRAAFHSDVSFCVFHNRIARRFLTRYVLLCSPYLLLSEIIIPSYSDIVLGDQDVQITLRRLSQALAVTDLNALTNPDSDLEKSMAELFGSSTGQSMQDASEKTPAEMKQELAAYVEAMKSRDSVRKIMGELQQVAPALVQVMLTERDTYMATGLDSLQNYQIITAVMGIAHQDGVERNLQSFGWKPVVLNCALAKPVTTA